MARPSKLTPAQIKFTFGLCQVYAHVAAQELNKPLVNFFWGAKLTPYYVHSAVRIKRDQYLDATGIHSRAELQLQWGHTQIEEFKLILHVVGDRARRKSLARWAVKKDFIKNITAAHRLLRRQLAKLPTSRR